MFGIGSGELMVILVVALLLFGPDKVPDVARWLGRIYREVLRVLQDFRQTLAQTPSDPTQPSAPLAPPASVAAVGEGSSAPAPPTGDESFYARRRTNVAQTDDYLAAETLRGASAPRLMVKRSDDYLSTSGSLPRVEG
jgi:TatA/E family protein of Tat protein translocase